MRYVIILLLSLCGLTIKAHDHNHGIENLHRASQAIGAVVNNEFHKHGILNDQSELFIYAEDEEGEWISARKDVLLAKSPVTHFHIPTFFDAHRCIDNRLQYRCAASIPPTYRYITQRTLRI